MCGLTTACTVILEYTELGARSALLATRGASIMPALFVGDVVVGSQAADGEMTCDTGVLRQRLALPFGMGMLSDREALRALAQPGVCRNAAGPASKLGSAVLLASGYRGLLFDSAQTSASRRHLRAADIGQMIDRNSGLLDHLGIVGIALRHIEGARERFLTMFARTDYGTLMSRFPAELIAALVVSRSGPAPETTRFDFDGVAIACWKRAADGSSYLSACPASAPLADTQVAIASGLEARDCPGASDLVACSEAIQAPAPDEQGYLWTGL